MPSSATETALYLLHDLDRWTFGELLATRANWGCTDGQGVEAAVRSYRLAIMQAVLKASGPEHEPLALAIGAHRALRVDEQAPYDEALAAWEAALAGRFLQRLRNLAPFYAAEAPLTRFAHGQYFKYSRRVSYLLKLPPALPCTLAPPAHQPS
jgi:hypothetical protein